jgi:hypothetical protein
VEAIITQLTQAGAQVTCILHLHRTRIPHRWTTINHRLQWITTGNSTVVTTNHLLIWCPREQDIISLRLVIGKIPTLECPLLLSNNTYLVNKLHLWWYHLLMDTQCRFHPSFLVLLLYFNNLKYLNNSLNQLNQNQSNNR